MATRAFAVARQSATPVADESILALTAAASEGAEITQIGIGGEATASAIQVFVLRRSTTNGITPTAQTPERLHSSSPASAIGAATTWGTEPVNTVTPPATWTRSYNAFGGVISWIAAPGHGIWILEAAAPDAEVSFEADVGTSPLSQQIIFEEI